MMNNLIKGDNRGYSLFELIVVIIIIGIITSVSLNSLKIGTDVSRTEETKRELNSLAKAITGDAILVTGGSRTDFGYLGDIGALPANLGQLVTNPGFGTWNGPYIQDKLTDGGADLNCLYDGWGTAYSYSGSTTIVSTGSGSNITREIVASISDLTLNNISVVVTDIGMEPPGATYKDSIKIVLSHPDGGGSIAQRTEYPANDGFAAFDSIPVGRHMLRVIYIPANDTLRRLVSVNPGDDPHIDLQLHGDLW